MPRSAETDLARIRFLEDRLREFVSRENSWVLACVRWVEELAEETARVDALQLKLDAVVKLASDDLSLFGEFVRIARAPVEKVNVFREAATHGARLDMVEAQVFELWRRSDADTDDGK